MEVFPVHRRSRFPRTTAVPSSRSHCPMERASGCHLAEGQLPLQDHDPSGDGRLCTPTVVVKHVVKHVNSSCKQAGEVREGWAQDKGRQYFKVTALGKAGTAAAQQGFRRSTALVKLRCPTVLSRLPYPYCKEGCHCILGGDMDSWT